MALSPGLVERWHVRRAEALAAVRAALEGGTPDDGSLEEDEAAPTALAQLVHKLAGSAAMFGEPELGEAAAALDRALQHGADAEERTALAQALIAIGNASPDNTGQPAGEARTRG